MTLVKVRSISWRAHSADRCLLGLRVLHRCGWAHGDISLGNILLFDDSVKIVDFEFAQQKDELKEHDRSVSGCFTQPDSIPTLTIP